MGEQNPTSRPSQPRLPPLRGRRAHLNAERVAAVRTRHTRSSEPRRAVQRAVPPVGRVKIITRTEPRCGLSKATASPARRAKRAAPSTLTTLDRVLAFVVLIVGLLMACMGAMGIVTSCQHDQFYAFGFFKSTVTIIAGLAWSIFAPRKMLEGK